MKDTTSAIHSRIIQTALENGDPEYALSYLESKKAEMAADDLMRARSVVNKDVYQRVADGIATNVVQGARAQSNPSDLGRMASITLDGDKMIAITAQSESGNRERDASGKLITSSAGAQGKMQVMPATARDPGHGIAPARDSSDAERTRVGTELLPALVRKYAGDPAKAWAAYNWGEGNVAAAIKEHGANWLAHAPKETRDYVAKNMAALDSGGGVPAKPTLQSIHDNVRAQVLAKYGATPPAGVLKQALTASTHQFEDMSKAMKADEDARTVAGLDAIAKAGGRFSAIPAAVRLAIPADQIDNVLSFGQKIAKGGDITDDAVYQALSDPKRLEKLSDNDLFKLRPHLSQADFKRFSAQRAAAQGKPGGNPVEQLNMAAMNSALANRFQTIGTDPSPKDGTDDAARVGTIKKIVTERILAQQKVTGKTLTDAEVEKSIDSLFAKSVTFRKSFFGLSRSEMPPGEKGGDRQRLLSMKASDIPSSTRDKLVADFAAAGYSDPSDADILGAYIRLKQMPQKPLPGQTFSGKIKYND